MNSRSLRLSKTLRLFYQLKTLRKSQWHHQEHGATSVDRALQSFSISANLPFMGATPPYSGTKPRRSKTATPLGLLRPLDRSLEDKISRGEFIDSLCCYPIRLLNARSTSYRCGWTTSPQVPSPPLCPWYWKENHRSMHFKNGWTRIRPTCW